VKLEWTESDGVRGTFRYAHNEYVQLAAELGAVGLGLLVALLLALARLLWQAHAAHPSLVVWAGVVAGTVALAVHSGFDFVWHLPAIPLTAAALIGLVTRPVGHASTFTVPPQ